MSDGRARRLPRFRFPDRLCHALLPVFLAGVLSWSFPSRAEVENSLLRLVAASTVGETGLIDWLARDFESRHPGVKVRTEYAGALAVLDRARAGQADLVISHHPGSEQVFVGEGFGVLRTLILYNDFVILGPHKDPLHLRQERDPTAVLRKLAAAQPAFLVAGTRSGTHKKLDELWTAAGIDPQWPGYEVTNSSSASTLRQAAVFDAYTFADMSTYLSNRDAVGKKLVPLSTDNIAMRNEYHATVVRRARIPGANQELAETFLDFLVSDHAQDRIRAYGERRYGAQIFVPAAHLDEGLRARRAADELQEKNRNMNRLLGLAVVLTVLGFVASGLFLRTRRLEKTARHSQERFALAVNGANDGIWDWDIHTDQAYFSPRLREILKHADIPELVREPIRLWTLLAHPEEREQLRDQIKGYLAGNGQDLFISEFRCLADTNQPLWLLLRGRAMRDAAGRAVRMSGSVSDITERKRQEAALEYQALHDALTGLPNRQLMLDRLQQAIRGASRNSGSVALILMDLDRFKEINDTLGHTYGDQVLQQVSARLQRILRNSDTVARMGGDEFAIVIPDTNSTYASHVAQKIHVAMHRAFNLEHHNLYVGGSLGIALYPQHGDDALTLTKRADIAMYVAKRGNSGCTIYQPEQDRDNVKRLELATELHNAIDANELELYYQPKIDLHSNRIVGVEALLRWMHPKRGMVPPDEMIPIAEYNGMIKPLTLWVLNAALQQSARWRASGIDLNVAVNLSVSNLQDPMLVEEIKRRLAQWGVPPGQLELEITESAMMADPQYSLEALTRLDTMGINLTVDDYGTGFSSLAYLKKLPVDIIKIDKSFVMSMDSDTNDAVIVKSTIDLAHNLGLKVVAEGVESEKISQQLLALGCNTAQGYYFCRPINAEAFTRWLEDSPWGLRRTKPGPDLGNRLVH